jgi:hypothetical protein
VWLENLRSNIKANLFSKIRTQCEVTFDKGFRRHNRSWTSLPQQQVAGVQCCLRRVLYNDPAGVDEKGLSTGLTIKFYATWSQLSPVSIHSTYFLQYCGARQASLSLYLHSHQILPASGPLHMLLVLLEASAYNVSTLPDFPLTLRFKF